MLTSIKMLCAVVLFAFAGLAQTANEFEWQYIRGIDTTDGATTHTAAISIYAPSQSQLYPYLSLSCKSPKQSFFLFIATENVSSTNTINAKYRIDSTPAQNISLRGTPGSTNFYQPIRANSQAAKMLVGMLTGSQIVFSIKGWTGTFSLEGASLVINKLVDNC